MLFPLARFFIWTSFAFAVSNCHHPLFPFPGFQQHVAYPAGLAGQFQGIGANNEHPPIREITAGFHINHPPSPAAAFHFLQSFGLNPEEVLKRNKNTFANNNNGFFPGGFLGPNFTHLFTPTTEKEKPQTEGQEEEYKKFLKEEAEYLEKETQSNELRTDFTDFSIDATESTNVALLEPRQKNFVRLNVAGKDYSYST